MIVPCLAVHSSEVIPKKPWPLHAFCPLQAFSAVLQSLVPLQELTPAQCTISPDALLSILSILLLLAQPDNISAAAPIANIAPLLTFDDVSIDMFNPLESNGFNVALFNDN